MTSATINLSGTLVGVSATVVGQTAPGASKSVAAQAMEAAPKASPPAELLAGLEAQRQQLASAQSALQSALAQMPTLRQTLIKQAEEQVLHLALEVAQKVLMQEIKAQRYEIDPIVKTALEQLPARHDVVVHLNPRDLDQCTLTEQEEGVQFLADPSIPPAQCRLDSPQGVVEMSIEQQLQHILEALKNPE